MFINKTNPGSLIKTVSDCRIWALSQGNSGYLMKALHCFGILIILMTLLASGCAQKEDSSGEAESAVRPDSAIIYLVRHAQSFKNISPKPDWPPEKLDSLTPEGQKEAKALGEYLKHKNITKIYTSPTGRTWETGMHIASVSEVNIPVLKDSSFLSLKNGKSETGLDINWAWRLKQWESGLDPRPVGGESLKDGQSRSLRKLIEILQTSSHARIVLVTHADICAALLSFVTGDPPAQAYDLNKVATGSVSEIIVSGKTWILGNKNLKPSSRLSD